MGYPNARKGIRMLEGSIRMPKRAFRYAGTKSGLLRRRVSGCPRMVFRCQKLNSDAQERHSDTLNKLLNGGYPDAKKCIRILIEAIWIQEDDIRMPATWKTRTTTMNSKKIQNKRFKSWFNARKSTQGALINVYGSYTTNQNEINSKS